MFKFATIGAFDNAVNVPYCKIPDAVTGKVFNGMGVTIDRKTGTMALTTAATGKGDVYVVYNVQRTFNFSSSKDFHFKAGDMPLVYKLASLNGYEVEFSLDDTLVTGTLADVTADKLLAYGANGKLGVVTAATGYAVWLKVIAVKGGIVRAEVVVNQPVVSAG